MAASSKRPRRPVRHPQPRVPGKPRLPEQRPRLPAGVYRDLRSSARPADAEDVMRAYGAAGEALEAGDTGRALELLTWAKSAAARSAAVREALGVALYRAGDYAGATTELLAYRRLSGRQDQNHLLADCARALGRHDKVAEYVEAMAPDEVPADRYAEAVIVLAAHTADLGDVESAIQALERLPARRGGVEEWHPRVWYLAAGLHAQRGDTERVVEYLEAIRSVAPGYLDVDERLASLRNGA